MPSSHLFEVDLAADGSELSSRKVPKLSRRYTRLKKKINTMAAPPPDADVWVCPACGYKENIDCSTCDKCNTARPRNTRSVLLVDKNSTHPVAVAARRVGGRPPPKARAAAPARESPSRGAKDAANERIAAQLGVVPVAEVVHSPVSSPDGPLVPPPAVARGGKGVGVGLGDDDDSSSSDDFPCRDVGGKTTGLDASSPPALPAFDYGLDYDGEDDFPTDGEVSKYTFHQRLIHYMDGALIDQQNRKAVELAILVEAGTKVRDMDPMKQATREQVLHRKYLEMINELEDSSFGDTAVRIDMTTMFKGGKARQGLSGSNLRRKLEREMTEVRKFAVKFPGFNNPAGLPSGLTQLRDMKAPMVAKLWKTKYPVMCFLIVTSLFCSLLSLS